MVYCWYTLFLSIEPDCGIPLPIRQVLLLSLIADQARNGSTNQALIDPTDQARRGGVNPSPDIHHCFFEFPIMLRRSILYFFRWSPTSVPSGRQRFGRTSTGKVTGVQKIFGLLVIEGLVFFNEQDFFLKLGETISRMSCVRRECRWEWPNPLLFP